MIREDINWDEIYYKFLPHIFQFFCYKIGNLQVAEELTAITFEKAWASRTKYRKETGQIQGWLIGIARHVASDHFRKPSREVFLQEGLEAPAAAMDEELQRRLDFQKVSRILSSFPDRERDLIALKYGAELTNREIAKVTRLSESNVGTILHRVINKLRKEMEA